MDSATGKQIWNELPDTSTQHLTCRQGMYKLTSSLVDNISEFKIQTYFQVFLFAIKVTVYYMSFQKCMSFSKCYNLEAKKVIRFKVCHQRDKDRTIICDKPNFENKAF